MSDGLNRESVPALVEGWTAERISDRNGTAILSYRCKRCGGARMFEIHDVHRRTRSLANHVARCKGVRPHPRSCLV